MTINTYVYPHPINVFVIRDLGVSLDRLCEMYGFKQSTVASWIHRDRRIESLPVSFIHSLSLASSRSMNTVYSRLLALQDEYDKQLEKNKKKEKERLEDVAESIPLKETLD